MLNSKMLGEKPLFEKFRRDNAQKTKCFKWILNEITLVFVQFSQEKIANRGFYPNIIVK